MSKHEAIVIRIPKIEPHPDPETVNLGLVKVWDYQCVVNKHQWKEEDLAIYLEPDTVVDGSRPEFAFLNKPEKPPQKHRIKVKRLRGAWSEGCLIPVPEGLTEGDDAWSVLGLERYEPTLKSHRGRPANLDSEYGTSGGWEQGPEHAKLPFGKYDIENFRKYNRAFLDREDIVITEKIHGVNAKYMYANDRMYCGSRAGWRTDQEEKSNIWWEVLNQEPWIEEFCKAHLNLMLFGEVFGQVQDLHYGATKNQLFFRVFDIWNCEKRSFCDADMVFSRMDIKTVPILYRGPYTKEIVIQYTDGLSKFEIANHIREGCVVKPSRERMDPKLGRVILKSVSNLYLERP